MDITIIPINNQTIAIQLPNGFTQQMLDIVRSIQGRRWDNTHKYWLIPATAIDEETKPNTTTKQSESD